MATPLRLVDIVVVFVPVSRNVPLAPELGAVNVTVTFPVPDPFVITVACSGANSAPAGTLCGVPLVAVIVSFDPPPPPPPLELEPPQLLRKNKTGTANAASSGARERLQDFRLIARSGAAPSYHS